MQSDAPRCVGVSVAVSVPYSSGQALQCWILIPLPAVSGFSPLFVGAGVAICARRSCMSSRCRFSPLFVGAGVAINNARNISGPEAVSVPYLSGQALQCSPRRRRENRRCQVSVPYLSGQALQSERVIAPPPLYQFQSPIRRGSRCNVDYGQPVTQLTEAFQSPIRRGSRCNAPLPPRTLAPPPSFSPLFVGAVVAILQAFAQVAEAEIVSVPYSSGQSLQWSKTGVNSTFCPNFVSTFCQGARQPTA